MHFKIYYGVLLYNFFFYEEWSIDLVFSNSYNRFLYLTLAVKFTLLTLLENLNAADDFAFLSMIGTN